MPILACQSHEVICKGFLSAVLWCETRTAISRQQASTHVPALFLFLVASPPVIVHRARACCSGDRQQRLGVGAAPEQDGCARAVALLQIPVQ